MCEALRSWRRLGDVSRDLYLPTFGYIYTYLPIFSHICLYFHIFAYIYQHVPIITRPPYDTISILNCTIADDIIGRLTFFGIRTLNPPPHPLFLDVTGHLFELSLLHICQNISKRSSAQLKMGSVRVFVKYNNWF